MDKGNNILKIDQEYFCAISFFCHDPVEKELPEMLRKSI